MINLNLVSLVVHLSNVRTSILYPTLTTHRQLSAKELKKPEIKENMIRVLVRMEDISNIIEEFNL